jgi:hypothetical protein
MTYFLILFPKTETHPNLIQVPVDFVVDMNYSNDGGASGL